MATRFDSSASVYVPSWARTTTTAAGVQHASYSADAATAAAMRLARTQTALAGSERHIERVHAPRPQPPFPETSRATTRSSAPPVQSPAGASPRKPGGCTPTRLSTRRPRGGAKNRTGRARNPSRCVTGTSHSVSPTMRHDEGSAPAASVSSSSGVSLTCHTTHACGDRWCARHDHHNHHGRTHVLPPPPPPSTPPPMRPPWRGAMTRMSSVDGMSPSGGAPASAGAAVPGGTSPWPSCVPVWVAPYTPDERSLSRELLDFASYAALSPAEKVTRQSMLSTLRAIVDTTQWPSPTASCGQSDANDAHVAPPRVVVYGSAALALSICTSDIDLTIVFPSPPSTPHTTTVVNSGADETPSEDSSLALECRLRELARLRVLHDALLHHFRDAVRVQLLDECRVPVVKLYDPLTRLAVDVHVCEEHHPAASPNAGRLAPPPPPLTTWTEQVLVQQRKWLATHPVATPLILLTKSALRQWNLNRLFTGGLSSTAVYSLVHRFLAEHEVATGARLAADRDDYPEAVGSLSPPPPPLTASNLMARGSSGDSIDTPAAAAGDEVDDGAGCCAEEKAPMSWTIVSPTGTLTTADSNSHVAWSSECMSTSAGNSSDDECEASVRVLTTPPPFPHPEPSTGLCGVSCYDWMDRHCQIHYHVSSFARLLLMLWMYLSNENFAMGYCIPDTFANLVRAAIREYTPDSLVDEDESEKGQAVGLRGNANDGEQCPSNNAVDQQIQREGEGSIAVRHEAASPGSAAPSPTSPELYVGEDLTAPSYRLPELLALFRHSAMTLEAFMIMPMSPTAGRSPVFHSSASLLSTVLVDPRQRL